MLDYIPGMAEISPVICQGGQEMRQKVAVVNIITTITA